PLALLYLDEDNRDLIAAAILCLGVPVKDHEVDRVADEPGISRGIRELREERSHLLRYPAFQCGARTVDGVLPDLFCVLVLPAVEIVLCPSFDDTDLRPEPHVRGQDTCNECNDYYDIVEGGHRIFLAREFLKQWCGE